MFWASTASSSGKTWRPVETSVPSGAEDDSESIASATAGDTVAPTIGVQVDPNRSRGESAWRNKDVEVGNMGLFVGNWGMRGTLADKKQKRLRQETHDRQILKCPGQVIVLCEATAVVEELLQQPAVAGTPGAKGLEGRNTFEHWVVRGAEEQAAVLIAARKDNTTFLDLLDYDVNDDHSYREKKVNKMARSRILTCKVGFKQNIGHLGKEIIVCGVHGHHKTMKFEWADALHAFLDRLAAKIGMYGIQFLAGDFNMFLTRVPDALHRRGIKCDCIAWYPWLHATTRLHEQALGLDSCGIFYIGGDVQVCLPWSLKHIDVLTAVAGDMGQMSQNEQGLALDVYEGTNVPGQHWSAYRFKSGIEREDHKNLKARLEDLLWPSSTQAHLDLIPQREGGRGEHYCPYLRFRQKALDKDEWLVDTKMHAGAHFPLCVFTKNASSRSDDAIKKRALKKREQGKRGAAVAGDSKGKRKGDGAVARDGKGKGQWGAAVAEYPECSDSGTWQTWGHSDSSWGSWNY